MPSQAKGKFDVKLQPLALEDIPAESLLGRRSIAKQFHGDLEATSQGQMLSAGAAVQGSAAYVAIERVTGTLGGKRGSFALYHTGVMNRGAPSLNVNVVPDSGTDELQGLRGSMTIDIKDGAHFYTFDYSIE